MGLFVLRMQTWQNETPVPPPFKVLSAFFYARQLALAAMRWREHATATRRTLTRERGSMLLSELSQGFNRWACVRGAALAVAASLSRSAAHLRQLLHNCGKYNSLNREQEDDCISKALEEEEDASEVDQWKASMKVLNRRISKALEEAASEDDQGKASTDVRIKKIEEQAEDTQAQLVEQQRQASANQEEMIEKLKEQADATQKLLAQLVEQQRQASANQAQLAQQVQQLTQQSALLSQPMARSRTVHPSDEIAE